MNIHALLDLSLFAQIDAALSAYLTALATINADVVVSIGKGYVTGHHGALEFRLHFSDSIPLLDLNLFVILKLVLTAKVLGIVNIL